KHWLDFQPYQMAHTPLRMSVDEAQAEIAHAWSSSYSVEAISEAVESSSDRPLIYRLQVLIGRLFFRGIYFPQMGKRAWVWLLVQNRRTILKLISEALRAGREARRMRSATSQAPDPEVSI
ncbi:MAG TPA: hypothetical protein VLE20_09135, partial [Blastocatellia bacterium]|nr:hypothetical protein [Blastocatellia bacterium]